MNINFAKLVSLFAGLVISCAAMAQVTTYKDNFSGTSASLKWTALNDACLTAGDGTGSIQACPSSSIATPDHAGYGALRLTPAKNYQIGAILSNFTFPSKQGMQVTFTTYTYGGSADGTGNNGADGIAFLLTDGNPNYPQPLVAGGSGGSLGYSCSNSNQIYEGLAHAYLGIGIDEFGNFLNSGDDTNSGITNTNNASYQYNTTYGTNTFANNANGAIAAGSGQQYQPERIGMRGAGNTTWAWLQSVSPNYYSGSVDDSKTKAACKAGAYVSTKTTTRKHGESNTTYSNVPITNNYNVIPGGYRVLPDDQPISDNSAQTRLTATGTPAVYSKNALPISYKLTLSPEGLLNFSYSYNDGAFQPVLVNSSITSFNGPIPDLFRFGFSAGTGGSNNIHEITCFQASPLQSTSSAGANTVQSGQYRTGTQIYLASYSTDNWYGSLVSAPLVVNGGVLSVSSSDNWDAKCVLTGGECPAMATTDPTTKVITTPTIAVQGPDKRVLLTADSSTGVGAAFQWDKLDTTEQKALNTDSSTSTVDANGTTRLAWLRGDRSTEQLASPTPGTLRARTAVLGDIINSSPTWVGAPSADTLPDAFIDGLYGSASLAENASTAQAYSTYVNSNVKRENVVYVGSNDGFLHGFDTGADNSSGVYDGTNNTGKELLGFMPAGVLVSNASDLSNPLYTHDYFVDATPSVGDLFYKNAWHTWLVGGVGTGGSEIYALDVSDPTRFTEANASSLVLGDWSSATLAHLGHTVGTPIIARMHNGKWAIIFGNGLDSGQTSGVYIGLVNPSTGVVTFQFLDTGVGTTTSKNGIAYVSSSDLDQDHIADYLYAGDLQGNVWRFDVTSDDSTKWAVSKFGNAAATPLYVAKDKSGNLQPITTAIAIAGVKTGSVNREMLLFGTGKQTPLTSTSGVRYSTGQQTFYGVWDWDMAAWNSKSTVAYAALSGTQSLARAGLLQQVLSSTSVGTAGNQVLGYRNISTAKKVCWQGSSTCGSDNSQYGWLFDLPATDEQIIYNPTLIGGAVVVQTAVPPIISALQCNPGLQTGWTMAFDPSSGGGFVSQSFFPSSDGSYAPSSGAPGSGAPGSGAPGSGAPGSDSSTVAGTQLNAVGSASTISYGGQSYLVSQTVTGTASLTKVKLPGGQSPSRVAWKELRN